MALARPALARLPGIGFHKLCGTGTGEGFTPLPNTAVYAILAVWPDRASAEEQLACAPVFARYRARAAESWSVFLAPVSSRGNWAGAAPFGATPFAADGQSPEPPAGAPPLAVLTRATLRLSILLQFWRQVPSISAAIGTNRDVAFKIGMGERPWTNQVTFSIWPDTRSMAAFAHADGPHRRAVRAVREGNWFREELYARFAVVGERGSWGGASPLETIRKEVIEA